MSSPLSQWPFEWFPSEDILTPEGKRKFALRHFFERRRQYWTIQRARLQKWWKL